MLLQSLPVLAEDPTKEAIRLLLANSDPLVAFQGRRLLSKRWHIEQLVFQLCEGKVAWHFDVLQEMAII